MQFDQLSIDSVRIGNLKNDSVLRFSAFFFLDGDGDNKNNFSMFAKNILHSNKSVHL